MISEHGVLDQYQAAFGSKKVQASIIRCRTSRSNLTPLSFSLKVHLLGAYSMIMFRITRTHLQSLQSGVGLACHAITGEGPRNRWTKRLARASLTKGASVLVVGLDSPCRILRAGIPIPSSLDASIHQRQNASPADKSQPKAAGLPAKPRQTHTSSIQKCEKLQNYNKLARDISEPHPSVSWLCYSTPVTNFSECT